MVCCALMACKKNNVNFSYSPTAPKAGETVTFSNLSDFGEDWLWTFGDGATSTLKSPTHVYKRPGTYRVSLKVDDKNAWMASKELTIYDTVPTFSCEDTTFVIFRDYTFTANVYNPYNYDLKLEWDVADSIVSEDGQSIICYFTQPNAYAEVGLRVVLNGDTTNVKKQFFIQDRKTNSVLIRTDAGDFRQRIFGARAEKARLDATATPLLDAEQDSAQTYNGYLFSLSELKETFPELEGFKIASRKIYFRAEGLWVANIDGANIVSIDPSPCSAMTLDTKDSRIYWANESGVWYMPFVGSDNNKFVTVPIQLNDLKNVTKIAADAELR